jgi:glycerate 2-kinase
MADSPVFGLRKVAYDLFRQSLADCSVERVMERKIRRSVDKLGNPILQFDNITIQLGRLEHIGVIAMGKASASMLNALLPYLQSLTGCELQGVLISPDAAAELPVGFKHFQGGHPVPNRASIEGAQAALNLIDSLKENKSQPESTLCLFLISGGASAMMELPLQRTISLADTVVLYRELVHSGASIREINCVRKHFSAVKGGRLAMRAEGVRSLSLLVSDVPSGDLDALASGPTLPDSSTVEQCRDVLARCDLLRKLPEPVQQFFRSQDLVETPKAHQITATAVTLLTSDDLADRARQYAEEQGFHCVIDNSCDDWDYRAAAKYLLDRFRALRSQHPRVCLISAGEITVEIAALPSSTEDDTSKPVHGAGGRNQHFALYAATLLLPSDGSTLIFSAGTDGIDGNSSAAGAAVDCTTLHQGGVIEEPDRAATESLRKRAEAALRLFDSGTFLASAGCAFVTGPTGNNLRDLRVFIADEQLPA